MADIPIVGQTSQVISWYPTAIMGCKCVPGNTAIIIVTGMNNAVSCMHCGKMYRIRPEPLEIHVDVILPTASTPH